MSTLTQTEQPTAGSGWDCYPLYRMSIDQYEKLVSSGVFTKRDKLQLVNGVLVAKMTQNDPHCTADLLCHQALVNVIPAGWHVRFDKPLRLPLTNSKPEPDQSVVRGSVRDFGQRSPTAADVGLVVEIADTSLADDRKMARTYAASGIPLYWIINLIDRQIEVYTDPTADGYGPPQTYRAGDQVPITLDGVVVGHIAVSDILP
jgi:Uma2 family endonuclease